MSLSVVLLGMVAVTGAPCVALAQAPSATELSAARELFESGLRAARAEQWTEARTAFERSLAIAPLPTTRLNLAGAQVQSGQLVAGAESYRTFLGEASSGRAARYRAEAERALADVESRTPRVRLEVVGMGASDTLILDGQPLARAAISVALRVDPGAHVIAMRRGRRTRAEARFTIAEREEQSVRLDATTVTRASRQPSPRRSSSPAREVTRAERTVEPSHESIELGAGGAHDARDDDDDGGGGLLTSPWLWIGVGIVVAGGVTVAVAVSASGGAPELYRGSLGPGMVTFE